MIIPGIKQPSSSPGYVSNNNYQQRSSILHNISAHELLSSMYDIPANDNDQSNTPVVDTPLIHDTSLKDDISLAGIHKALSSN